MTILLDTGFEHGLAPGGLGFDSITVPAGVSLDTGSSKRHGTYGAKCNQNGYLVKTLASQVCTFSFYYTAFTSFGLGANPIIRVFVSGGPFVGAELNQKNSGKLSPIIQSGTTTTGADSTLAITIGTTYLIDGRADLSGSTWTLDYKVSDTNGSVLYTAPQVTKTGLSATSAPQLRLGPDSTTGTIVGFDDVRVTDQAADYPIGAHTSDDTEAAGLTTFPPSWIDDPTRITNGILVGLNAPWGGTYAAPYPPVFTATEGAAKLNRASNFSTIDYTPVTPPFNLYAARQLMNGNMFGDGKPRVAIISGLAFDGFTTDWPAGGLADFISGAMDTTLQAWCDLFNNELPNYPFFWRIWREHNSLGTIYGSNGAGITPHAGKNETAADFVTAWRHVHDYVSPRVANVRWMWSPQVGDGAGGVMTTANLALRYPGSAYVDWVAPTAYVGGPSREIDAALVNVYAGWNPSTGSIDPKPWGVSESQVDKSDGSRISDVSYYTTAFTTNLPLTKMVNFWDCIGTCQYPVTDTPAGYLSAFQTMVSTPPFLGVNTTTYTDTQAGTVTLSGSLAESYTHLNSYSDSPTGAVTLGGALVESHVYADAVAGAVTLAGVNTDRPTTPHRRHRRHRAWPVRRTQ